MRRIIALYRTSVGKKITMAVTGAVLLAFVIGHMLGNLKVFQGQEKFDAYAEWLRDVGYPLFPHTGLLWIVRIVLLGAVLTHIISAAQLTLMSWQARDVSYKKEEKIAFSYASYTMRWGGIVVGLYVIYHLLHLTFGTAHHDFIPGSAYHNVVSGFKIWWVSMIYAVAMVPLALHVYHGIWSGLQTLGVNNPRYNAWRRPVAGATAGLLFLGYVSIPLSVLAGFVK